MVTIESQLLLCVRVCLSERERDASCGVLSCMPGIWISASWD